MPFIFHQNMKCYGGGNALAADPNRHRTRNQQFDIDFAAIQAGTGAFYIVAGFTEIMNAGMAATGIASRAVALDPGLSRSVVIGVGNTVIGGRDEYIGIAWDPHLFTIQNAGQVVYNAADGHWECVNTAAPVPPTLPLPNPGDLPSGSTRAFNIQTASDRRGLAYVHGRHGTHDCIFAFMHNMHTVGDRSGSFSALGTMVERIHAAIDDDGTRDFVGGDFNIAPRDPTGTRGRLGYAAATYVSIIDNQSYFKDTTYFHPYDFWLTNQGKWQTTFTWIRNRNAAVHRQTLYSNVSDHAAIRLTYVT